MTFENFYPGKSYNFESEAAKAVAERTDGVYSPLIFCGPCGVGKSHLLSAIAKRAKESAPDRRVIHISADRFIEEMIEGIKDGEMDVFREKFREADLLIIDDLELVAGKPQTQEELLRLLDERAYNKRQVVLALNDCIQDHGLSQRMVSLLSGGIVLGMQLPDEETKSVIIDGV